MNKARVMLPPGRRLLLVVVGMLGALTLWQALRVPQMPDLPSATATAIPDIRKGAVVAAMSSDALQAPDVAARPLFNPSRTRFVQPQAAAVQPTATAPSFRTPLVVGIVGTGNRRLALVRVPEERDLRRLREGDVYDGWQVAAIRNDGIILKNGAEEREIRLILKEAGGGSPSVRR